MDILNKTMTKPKKRPVKVVQFGEGNFLRGFADWMLDIANDRNCFDGAIVMIKPTEFGSLEKFHRQDCQYTVSLRGITQGEAKISNRQITSVSDVINCYTDYEQFERLAKDEDLRFVISNTTEAGIVFDDTDRFDARPPKSFPGKLTKFLYHRFTFFQGDPKKGLILLPAELIDDNGAVLKQCVMQLSRLWALDSSFLRWVEESCIFTSTLVDRIVTGYPKDAQEEEWEKLGYEDRLLVTGEPFALWVIEGPKEIREELPLDKAGLPVIFTDDLKPYKQRKVRILNGAHTSFALASYLAGNNFVKESMDDPDIRNFMMKTLQEEVLPTLSLPRKDLETFVCEVVNRFNNPYVKHALLAISLNSVSKWKARCLPTLLDYLTLFGRLPKRLTFSLAALMEFYSGTALLDRTLTGRRGTEEYPIQDDLSVLEFFRDHSQKDPKEFTESFLGRKDFFGQDLNEISGLTDAVAAYLTDIRTNGMRAALCKIS